MRAELQTAEPRAHTAHQLLFLYSRVSVSLPLLGCSLAFPAQREEADRGWRFTRTHALTHARTKHSVWVLRQGGPASPRLR